MNIIKLLKEDHRLVDHFFEQISQTTERAEKTRQKLFAQVDKLLSSHLKIEETLFYPVLKEYEETRALAFQSIEEHAGAKELIHKLKNGDYSSEIWTARFKFLVEIVRHHVKEEEKMIFPKVNKTISPEILDAMAKKMLKITAKEEHVTVD